MTEKSVYIGKKIPQIPFPEVSEYNIAQKEENIVDIRSLHNPKITVEPKYYEQGIEDALDSCYVRKTVAAMLEEAAAKLPDDCALKIYDGFRPYCVQKNLYDNYFERVKNNPENKNCTLEQLHYLTGFFVSRPSLNIKTPFLHGTGGAVDLTIEKNGQELDMGTGFDDFSHKAWAGYFEKPEQDETVRNNRRLLYNLMLSVGFTNLPSEWWHYDYGTKFWGYFKGEDALYEGMLEFDEKLLAAAN